MESRQRIPTGSSRLDSQLSGGLAIGEVTLVYGEPGTGKTALALSTIAKFLLHDHAVKIFYIDSDSKFTPARLIQMTGQTEVLRRIVYIGPTTFEEQAEVLDRLHEQIQSGDLVCVDSITGLYRVETGDSQKTFMENKELNRQLGFLKEIVLLKRTTVILTGQVRSVLDSPTPTIEPVAQRLLRYWSDKVIRLDNTATQGVKQATVEKPKSLRSAARFRITEKGLGDEDRW